MHTQAIKRTCTCLTALALASGCARQANAPIETRAADPSPQMLTTPVVLPPAIRAFESPAPSPATRNGWRLQALPSDPIEVRTDCKFKDEAGFVAELNTAIQNARVESFKAYIAFPKRGGACKFDLAEFRQTQSMPTVQLRSIQSQCSVRVWAQHDSVTFSFDQCEKHCSQGTADYLWPIVVNRHTGRCS